MKARIHSIMHVLCFGQYTNAWYESADQRCPPIFWVEDNDSTFANDSISVWMIQASWMLILFFLRSNSSTIHTLLFSPSVYGCLMVMPKKCTHHRSSWVGLWRCKEEVGEMECSVHHSIDTGGGFHSRNDPQKLSAQLYSRNTNERNKYLPHTCTTVSKHGRFSVVYRQVHRTPFSIISYRVSSKSHSSSVVVQKLPG